MRVLAIAVTAFVCGGLLLHALNNPGQVPATEAVTEVVPVPVPATEIPRGLPLGEQPIKSPVPPDTLIVGDFCLVSIMWVESRINSSAYNKAEEALGCLQIRPCVVYDLQRLGYKFTLKDRQWSHCSVAMFWAYTDYYAPNGTMKDRCRVWNGGPDGCRKPATLDYWNRVVARSKAHS